MNTPLEYQIEALEELSPKSSVVHQDAMINHLFGGLSGLIKYNAVNVNGENVLKINDLLAAIRRSYNYAKISK